MNIRLTIDYGNVVYKTYESSTNLYVKSGYYDVPPFNSELLKHQLALASLQDSKPKELPKLVL